jgi:tetratricopeptide (TPR) repeat protein
MPQESGWEPGLRKQIGDPLRRAASKALWRLLSRLFGGAGEQRAPLREPAPEDTSPVPEETVECIEEPDEASTDVDSLLHRLAAGEKLSSAGTALCRRLIEENPGYEPNSVLEVAMGEGRFNAEDLTRIAAFLVSIYSEPGADTYANQSLAQRLFEGLAENGVATRDLVKLCVQAMADAPAVSLTHPMQGYLTKAGGKVGDYRSLVIAAFHQESYSAYCRKQPEEEKQSAPASWNDWEGRNAWSHIGSDWPLADLFLELDTGREVDALLEREPPAWAPAEQTLHYFLLRRSWLKSRESPGSLAAVGRLLRATAGKPHWKPLHDRALLVFRDHWTRGQWGRAAAMAAEVYQGLLDLQPGVDPRNAPDPLPGMDRLHLTRLQQPQEAEAAAPRQFLLPGGDALVRRFERLRASVDEKPDDPGAWHEIAGIYREISAWDRAIIAEDLAIEHHPKFAVAYYGRGKTRMEIRQWAEAVDDFTAAIRLWEFPGGLDKFLTLEEPRDEYVDSYRARGVANSHQGHHDAAIDDLSTAVRLRRFNARLHYELAYLEERAGRNEDARVHAYDAGILYLDRGEKEEAAECVSLLDRLGANEDADNLRIRMAARRPSDLP